MKANRKFKEDSEAVSAVIGVILMVAITVAIAATVFYYVTSLASTEGGSTPKISWSVNAADDEIVITKCTPSDSAYGTAAGSANLLFKQDGTIYYPVSQVLTQSGGGAVDSDTIDAGDTIDCSAATAGETITVVWNSTNEVIGSFSI